MVDQLTSDLPSPVLSTIQWLGDEGAFNTTAIDAFTGVENGFFFDLLSSGEINKCSTAYRWGHGIGTVISLAAGAWELRSVPKLWSLTVGRNGLYYGGRRGAWGTAIVTHWLNSAEAGGEHLSVEGLKHGIEELTGGDECGCKL